MILKRERSDAEKLRRHLHGDKGAKFSKGKIPCIDGGGYNRDYYHNGDKRHIAFGILRLPHGYFPGTIINIIPTLTISSWEHNNFIYEDRTEPRRMLVSRPLHPIRGGYILVLVKNLAEVLCPAYPEQSNVIIAQVSA